MHATKFEEENKATGPDEIRAKVVKLITGNQIVILKDLYLQQFICHRR